MADIPAGLLSLASMVTGILPVANGGTGLSALGTGVQTALGVNVGSAGAFVVNGGALGTPASGSLANCTGLPVSSGISGFGTGVATALGVNVGVTGALVTDSSVANFTNKTGNISQWTNDSGYLTSVTQHNILSATHGDTLADTVVRGDILYGNSTPKWARLPKPSALSGLSHDGTDVSWVTATGTGAPVRATNAVLVTPSLGAATATSVNKVAITAPASSATLTIADSKTFTTSNTLTLTATDGSTLAIGAGGTLGSNAYTSTAYAPLASPTFTGTVSGASASWTSTITDTQSIGATSTDGLILTNTTAAAAGAQQWSPRLRLTGQGWKTASTAASQTVDWIIENQPVQATTNPKSYLCVTPIINGTTTNGLFFYADVVAQPKIGLFGFDSQTSAATGLSGVNANNVLAVVTNTAITALFSSSNATTPGMALGPTYFLGWTASTLTNSTTSDLMLGRDAADTLAIRRSTNAQTFNIYNTYTDASNYERLTIKWSSNVASIGMNAAGTGSTRLFALLDEAGTQEVTVNSSTNAIGVLLSGANFAGGAGTRHRVGIGNGASITPLSGTTGDLKLSSNYNPGSTSTMVVYPLWIAPTINYSAGTPGAGSYEALKIAVTETALPTGQNYLIRASAGSAGTTDVFAVTNAGSVSALNFNLHYPGSNVTGMGQSSDNIYWMQNGSSFDPNASALFLQNQVGLRTRSTMYFGWSSTSVANGTVDLLLARAGAAALQLGADVNGAAVSQSINAANGITGTDKTGGNLTLASGKGTGAGAVSSLIFQTPTVLTTGTTAQSLATRLTLTSGSAIFATDIVELRNSTTAQTLSVYNTFTDASNYERYTETWSSNVLRIGTKNAGTGTARVLSIDYGGTTTSAISVPITSGAITIGGGLSLAGQFTSYNGITARGFGVPLIVGYTRSTGLTAANAALGSYTVGASDGSFDVVANVNATTATAFSFNVAVNWTDETNTLQTMNLTFSVYPATLTSVLSNAAGGLYAGVPLRIRCKAATAITFATAGTFTTVTYNVDTTITQVA